MSDEPTAPRGPAPPERLHEAKQRARALVMPIEGVQGLGIGDGTIRVYVRDRLVVPSLPADVDGVPVEPVVVGEVTTY